MCIRDSLRTSVVSAIKLKIIIFLSGYSTIYYFGLFEMDWLKSRNSLCKKGFQIHIFMFISNTFIYLHKYQNLRAIYMFQYLLRFLKVIYIYIVSSHNYWTVFLETSGKLPGIHIVWLRVIFCIIKSLAVKYFNPQGSIFVFNVLV